MVALDDAVKAKVLKQVEFYFSDSNLPKDRFLRDKMDSDPEKYVDLCVIAAFSRMRDLLKLTVTEPYEIPAPVIQAVAEVLRTSSKLEVDAEGVKIRRKQALADEATIAAAVDARSLYAKPFPMDTNIDKVTEFFAQYGSVNCVRMRRTLGGKSFRGSLFVEFENVEEAEKVLALSLEYEGAPLRLEKKVAYCIRKREERKAKAGQRKGQQHESDAESNDDLPDGVGGKVGGEVLPEAAARAAEAKAAAPAAAAAAGQKRGREEAEGAEGADAEGKRARGKAAKSEGEGNGDEEMADEGDEDMGEGEEEGAEVEEAEPKFDAGCLLCMTLESPLPELVGHQMIVDVFGGRTKVRFVELNEDKKSGYIRFQDAELAQAALAEFNAKEEDAKTIATVKGALRAVEGEEEMDYYKRAQKKFSAAGSNRGGRGGGRGGRGGRFGGRGGRGGRFGGRGGRGGRFGGRGGRGGRGRGRGRN